MSGAQNLATAVFKKKKKLMPVTGEHTEGDIP